MCRDECVQSSSQFYSRITDKIPRYCHRQQMSVSQIFVLCQDYGFDVFNRFIFNGKIYFHAFFQTIANPFGYTNSKSHGLETVKILFNLKFSPMSKIRDMKQVGHGVIKMACIIYRRKFRTLIIFIIAPVSLYS